LSAERRYSKALRDALETIATQPRHDNESFQEFAKMTLKDIKGAADFDEQGKVP
jgi:hypothetical protein